MQRQFINFSTGAPLLPSDINKYQEYGGKKIKLTVSWLSTLRVHSLIVGWRGVVQLGGLVLGLAW